MPNLDVSGMFVEHAQICFSAINAVSFTLILAYSLISHCLQLFALRIVSAVVKVLELTKINVYSGLRPSVARSISIGSTFAKNLIFLPRAKALY